MKKVIALSVATALSCSLLQAKAVEIDGKDAGNIDMMFKAMTVIDDKENGHAPSNGSGFLIKLKYETPSLLTEGLKIGVGMYVNGDGGLTEWDEKAAPDYNKAARGMVVSERGETVSLLGEFYASYENDYVKAKAGRQILNTPLTTIKWSLMPNFYEAYTASTDVVSGLTLTATHMAKMSFGSRAAADFGTIGEGTGTAGASVDPKEEGGKLSQAKFYNMGTIALGTNGDNKTDGRTALGVTYKGIKNLKVDAWLYHADDIVNDYYAQVSYALALTKKMKLKLNAHYLGQESTGDKLADATFGGQFQNNFNMYGVKVALGNKKMGGFAAFESSADGQYFNAWGADPSYTSSIFSRNIYRKNVDAYKLGVHYKIMKGLMLKFSYANYGQSDTLFGKSANLPALTDAYEIDTVLVYKPTKDWMFKIFNTRRVSEYDGTVNPAYTERRMNHYRLIASYKF